MRTKQEKEAFWLLSKKEQRIAIAKDVLAQIAVEFFRPKSGNYLHSRDMDSNGFVDDELEKKTSCEVCALGACFVSAALLGNRFKVREFPLGDGFQPVDGVSGVHVKKSLQNIFEDEQITLIESAFEKGYYRFGEGYKTDITQVDKAIEFGHAAGFQTERMVAIMENIVSNNGEFIP